VKEQVHWTIHTALNSTAGGQTWRHTRQVNEAKGKEEALKYLRNKLRWSGAGLIDKPDYAGAETGITITLPETGQQFLVKYRDILSYVLNETKDLPYDFIGVRKKSVKVDEKLAPYPYRKEILEELKANPRKQSQLYYTFYTRLDAETEEEQEKISAQINRIVNELLQEGLIETKDDKLQPVEEREEPEKPSSMMTQKEWEQQKKTGKPRWDRSLERRLRDVFESTLLDGGLKPRSYMAKLRVEYPILKEMNSVEEMEAYVIDIANEVLMRWSKPATTPKFEPLSPERERQPSPIRRDEDIENFVRRGSAPSEPSWPPPISDLRFPRRPSNAELDQIRAKFYYDLMMCGIANPLVYNRQIDRNFAQLRYNSMEEMREAYRLLVDAICAGKQPPELQLRFRARPFESVCEGVQWLVSLRQAETLEDIQLMLDSYGVRENLETIRLCIKQGIMDHVSSFVVVTQEYLEQLLGETLD
jgi:hypothetical protein